MTDVILPIVDVDVFLSQQSDSLSVLHECQKVRAMDQPITNHILLSCRLQMLSLHMGRYSFMTLEYLRRITTSFWTSSKITSLSRKLTSVRTSVPS